MNSNGNNRPLIIPALGGIYAALGDISETILRVVAGAALVVHGSGKIVNPMGSVEMVEGLGFYPGVFWSPLLAATEFFGRHFTYHWPAHAPCSVRDGDRACSHHILPRFCAGAGLERFRKIYPVDGNPLFLRHSRRKQPLRRCQDRQGVLNSYHLKKARFCGPLFLFNRDC